METKTLIRVATKLDLPESGKVKEVFANEKFLCMANIDGEIYVMDNVCPHWGGPLGRGRVEHGKIVCPWHGWTFDPKTGETPRKANTRVATYRVIIEGEDVFVEF
jgi:nitrite reductase (NADH) small subunit